MADLQPGMVGTGWTVVEGTEPVSFDVEVLGVLTDGIAPGIDFILVQVSGPVIDQTGGIAAGFSGSPMYIDGALVGSVSYGFAGADQTFGGVTPAENLVALFDYPSGAGSLGTAGTDPASRLSAQVRLPSGLRRTAARATQTATEEIPTVAEPLPVPVAVSGLNARGMRRFDKALRLAGLPFVSYRAGSADLAAPVAERLGPGDAVAGAASIGDLTFAGVGTATAVCDDLLVAFGHPFFFDGGSGGYPMAMYGATVLAVIPDPSSLFGGFKLANLTDLHGIVDQDRLAGIRGVQGAEPASMLVTSLVVNPDLGKLREGDTTVFKQWSSVFPLLPDIAAFHLLANYDAVFDRVGDGTATLRFVLEGIGPSGEPFRLDRLNMHFSESDVSFESIFELFSFLFQIQDNPFGPVEMTSVHVDSTITQEHLTAKIMRVKSASSVQPRLLERTSLRVARGDTIRLRVFLLPQGATDEETVDLLVPVPRRRSFGGSLEVRGGLGGCFFCFFEEEGEEPSEPPTFEALLQQLRRTDRNNDLVAELSLDPGPTQKSKFRTDTVILGRERIRIVTT